MIEELDLQISDSDFKNLDIDFLEIELNPPVTEEDIRYAQLEELICRDKKNEFTQNQEFTIYSYPGVSWTSFNLQ